MIGSNRTKTAIIILNWNGLKFLEQFLPSVSRFSTNDGTQIFVADNGSTDDSIQFIKTNYPNIKIIAFDKNYGYTGGYNKALFQIEADYFVLLNSDIEVTPGWLTAPVAMLDADKSIAAVAPKIKSFHDKKMFEYAGAAGGFIDKFGFPFCRGRILGEIEEDKGQYNTASEIFWASGACMFMRADLYKSEGGLDDDFFAHMEEIDLCWRLQNKDFKIMYCPDSEVFHVGGGTLPNNNPHKLFLNYRNNLLLLHKNLPKNKLLLTIFIRLFLDGISAILYLASFKFSYFNAVWKAHFAFYGLISKNKKKRIKTNITTQAQKNHYPKSIVWAYYIKKKTVFQNLDFFKK